MTMVKSLIKLLAISAVLAGIAQSRPTEIQARQDTCPFTTVVPDNAYYQAGDNFVLEWNPDKLPPGTLTLQVYSQLVKPIITGYGTNIFGQTVPIYDFQLVAKQLGSHDLTDRSFTWPVEILGNATGPDYVYVLSGYYTVKYDYPYGDYIDDCSTGNFHISA